MGAGSSVKVDSSDDELDYGTQQPFNQPEIPKPKSRTITKKTLDEVIAADDLVESPPTTRKAFTDKNDNRKLSDDMTQVLEGDKLDKRKGLFGFRKKDDGKTVASVHDEDGKKGKENQRGFRLFNWKKEDKKAEPKDAQLQDDIDDIEKTFESLGISGKNSESKNDTVTKKRRKNSDDIIKLEPMRNRSSMRSKAVPQNGLGSSGSQQSSSGCSKRNFKYSWEQESLKSPVHSTEWTEFSLSKIEGFDLEKFKKLNAKGDTDVNNISAYNARLNSQGDASNWNYDRKEREMLDSIERSFFQLNERKIQ